MTGRPSGFITAVLPVVLSLASVPGAYAQQIGARAVIARPLSTVLTNGLREETAGIWGGASVDLRAGPLVLSGTGLRGRLIPTDSGGAFRRTGGELSARVQVFPRPWLGVEADYTERAFTSLAGFQRWRMVGVGLRAARIVSEGTVTVYGGVMYFPSVTVTGQESPDVGLRAETGVRLGPNSLPFALLLGYRFERYDFPGGGGRRLEQFESLTISIEFVFERSQGRWVLINASD